MGVLSPASLTSLPPPQYFLTTTHRPSAPNTSAIMETGMTQRQLESQRAWDRGNRTAMHASLTLEREKYEARPGGAGTLTVPETVSFQVPDERHVSAVVFSVAATLSRAFVSHRYSATYFFLAMLCPSDGAPCSPQAHAAAHGLRARRGDAHQPGPAVCGAPVAHAVHRLHLLYEQRRPAGL